jgi:RNA polymerase sigma factor (sigma-70 family)
VAETREPKISPKKNWVLGPEAFGSLLGWLDEGVDSGGERYLEVRRRLVHYFDRKNCLAPDELADETLNRVARRLEEEGVITGESPAQFCYITARFVFLEHLRKPETEEFDVERPPSQYLTANRDEDENQETERRSECLGKCLDELDPDHRRLIIGYYTGQQRVKIENRRAIAAQLGITINALSIRAYRIRDTIEACVSRCLTAR